GARHPPGRAVAQGQLWHAERAGVAVCRGHDDRGRHAQAAASPCPCVYDGGLPGRIYGAAGTLTPPLGFVRDRCCWRIDSIDLKWLFYGRVPISTIQLEP